MVKLSKYFSKEAIKERKVKKERARFLLNNVKNIIKN